jgi:serine/threonine-protein kinase RsbW
MTEADGGAPDPRAHLDGLLEEDPADLYENAPCGYLSTLPDGEIVKVNRTFCAWSGRSAAELLGRRFPDLLSSGGRAFHETHLRPLLRMQGAVREIAVDVLRLDGSVLPCLLNAVEVRDESGTSVLVRVTLFEATARRRYERELLAAQRVAQESEGRSRTLQQVVSDLAAAVTVDDVATVIVERSRTALSAKGAALVLVEEPPAAEVPALRLLRADDLPPSLLDELREPAGGRLVLEMERGVRSVAVDERLGATQPGLAGAMSRAGLTELVVVPVLADSRRLGVLLLGLGADAHGLISLDDPEARLPMPAADVDLLRTIGRQAGQALERARLHEQTARQAERAAFLLEAAQMLAEAADLSETVEKVAALAVDRLADVCVVDLAGEQGLVRAVARHRDSARQPLADELGTRHMPPRGSPHPGVVALETGRTQWVRVVDDAFLHAATVDADHLAVARRLELGSLVSVPLTAEGRRLGVLTLGIERSRGPFRPADVEVAEQLALQVSLVVAKAQRYELDMRTSHTLQARLLPAVPPPVPGLALAVRYLAATQGVEIGGDFYDVVPLPGGSVALTVGDVVGHDITAAATMGQLTAVYRALLTDGPPPSAVIDRLQASWSLLGFQRMATALFGSLDPASGQLRLASAGHLPPLLLAGGSASYLPVAPSRMLGAPPSPSPVVEWAGVLPVEGTLLLFTDGLVESRSADLDEGLDRLLSACAESSAADPDGLCERLLSSLTGRHRADDIALLALTRTG